MWGGRERVWRRLALAAPLVLAGSLAGAGPPILIRDLAWSPDGSRVACSIRCGGPGVPSHLWILDLRPALARLSDTTPANPARAAVTATQVTSGEHDETSPAWSPDGASLVFSSTRDGDEEIYRMDVNGTEVVRLTSEPSAERSPSCTADGRVIVFASAHGRWSVVHMMNADGSGWAQLSDDSRSDSSPEVSPDARRIALTAENGGPDSVLVMNLPGTGRRVLFPGRSPSWTPDSKRLLVSHQQNIWEVSIDGSAPARVLCPGLSAAAAPAGDCVAVLRARGADTSLHLRSGAREVEVELPGICTPGW